MRRDRRSALREEARSKLREGNSQQVKDILEEFGFNAEEPHEMIDLQAPNNMENEMLGKKGALNLTQTKHWIPELTNQSKRNNPETTPSPDRAILAKSTRKVCQGLKKTDSYLDTALL